MKGEYLFAMIPRPSEAVDTAVSVDYNSRGNQGCCSRCIQKIQDAIVGNMERFFYWYGKTISKYPAFFIVLCILVTGIASIGLLNMRMENNGLKLWIPSDSSQRINSDWLWEHYPPETRYATMIFVSENILVPDVIQTMYRIHKEIEEIVTVDDKTWPDMCMKAPIVQQPDTLPDSCNLFSLLFSGKKKRRKKRQQNDDEFDDFDYDAFEEFDDDNEEGLSTDTGEFFSGLGYPTCYCEILESIEYACIETSILELWANDGKYDERTTNDINNLTYEDIIGKINDVKKSGVFLIEKNFTAMLSGITYDNSTGRIIGARATRMNWLGKMNTTSAKLDPAKGRGEPIAKESLRFEGEMIKVLLNQTNYPKGLSSYPNVKRSFGDIAGATILGDVGVMAIGYMIVFVYVMIMLGKFNCLEMRSYLAFAGILGVIMGIIVSYGFCSAINLFFGPMHSVLPFLLLGIGIDDMFVIVQCWDALEDQRGFHKDKLDRHERLGEALAHAGVAITITSITDIIAFGVGGTTVLPALMSFCLYASVGIVATYFFQTTFFVAFFSIDIRRKEARRNACCCFKHNESWKPNNFSQINFIQKGFHQFGRLLTLKITKIFVIVITLGITGCGIWGNILLRQEFDPSWFLPSETYLAKWFKVNKMYFPFGGDRVTIWCADIEYVQEFDQLNNLAKNLEKQVDIVDNVKSWTLDFEKYADSYLDLPIDKTLSQLSNEEFHQKFTQFLFSPRGGQYRQKFKFTENETLTCGETAPRMILSEISFVHKLFTGPEEHVPAMNRIKALIENANLSGRVFPLSQGYASWETDEVIAVELYRNIALALLCVFITTLLLLANVTASILVMGAVLLSLIDVGGFMHFWNLTIDTVSCNNLIIAIGLCVDYSAHIAHRFLLEPGDSRDSRVRATLSNIGPAVLNGGITTTLAFILLAGSRSHVFSSFFKIFFLVVTFGLFHGLIVLPVLLSFMGPKSTVLMASSDDSANRNSENNDTFDQHITESKYYNAPNTRTETMTITSGPLPGSPD